MKPTKSIAIGFPPRQRVFHLERLPEEECWRLWLAANPQRMRLPTHEWHGTFLLLYDDGTVHRITVDDSEVYDRIMVVKDADEEKLFSLGKEP